MNKSICLRMAITARKQHERSKLFRGWRWFGCFFDKYSPLSLPFLRFLLHSSQLPVFETVPTLFELRALLPLSLLSFQPPLSPRAHPVSQTQIENSPLLSLLSFTAFNHIIKVQCIKFNALILFKNTDRGTHITNYQIQPASQRERKSEAGDVAK